MTSRALSRSVQFRRTALFSLTLAALNAAAAANEDLTTLSLEQLMSMEVTSAARKPQRLADTPAAVHVITAEDIKRSGAVTIPELLRNVPGVQVARIEGSRWAVSVRGFNSRFSNKLQVLLDGRSIYSPLFSGTIWETHEIPLAEIERIEVIRGPGGAYWGANAMNGVINIITKSANDTLGGEVTTHAGDLERGGVSARYGARVGETSARVYAQVRERTATDPVTGPPIGNDFSDHRAGLRMDHQISAGQRITVAADVSSSEGRDRFTNPIPRPPYAAPRDVDENVDSAVLMARYERNAVAGGDLRVQTSVTRSKIEARVYDETRTTAEMDATFRLRLDMGHELLIGGELRNSSDDVKSDGFVMFKESKKRFTSASAFLHDEFAIVPDRVIAALGARVENNSSAGTEWLPSARLLWRLDTNHQLWASAARAVRTPSRAEASADIDYGVLPPGVPQNPSPLPVLLRYQGREGLANEKLNAFEVGYRGRLADNLALDVTAYQNRYIDLSGGFLGAPQLMLAQQPYTLVPILPQPVSPITVRGTEAAVDWRVLPHWRLQLSGTRLRVPSAPGTEFSIGSRTSPKYWWSVVSQYDIWRDWQFDLSARGVSALADGLPAYATFDARLAWRPMRNVSLELVGRDLAEKKHVEFPGDGIQTEYTIPRSVHIQARVRF